MTSPTGNVYLDSISWGGWRWVNNSGPLVLTYYFDNDYSTWTNAEKLAYEAAFQAWADVAGFTIQEVVTEAQANFVAHSLSDNQMNTLFNVDPGFVVFGVHETPQDATAGQIHGWFNYQTYSWPSSGVTFNTTGLAEGGWGFRTFMHEIGHGLGLAHPHDNGGGSPLMPGVIDSDDYGDNNLNQGLYTIMSYNRGWEAVQNPQGSGISAYGYNYGPGAFDIAIIQYLYGANTSFNAGNDVYLITENGAWRSIWDTGGTDEIRYSGSHSVTINLNSATLDNTSHGGGYLSYIPDSGGSSFYGGYTIAADYTNVIANVGGETGVIIENATGGSGNDILVGNSVANILRGNAGNDTLYGLDGNDIFHYVNGVGASSGEFIYGGNGFDRILLDTIFNGDTFDFRGSFGSSIEVLEFAANGTNLDVDLIVNAGSGQIARFASLHVDGNNAAGSTERIFIYMSTSTPLSLSGWTFQDWGGQGELITIYGDVFGEIITGSSQNDAIFGFGGFDTSRYELNSSGARWTYNANGSWTVVSSAGTDTLTGMEFLDFNNWTVKLWRPVGEELIGDFNGDGFEDLLFRNQNGEPAIMFMNGTTPIGGGGFGAIGFEWSILGVGDLNGDNRDDILWRNANGEAAVWLMDGTTIIGGTGFGVIGNDWQLLGLGDFNNDGRDDIVWRNVSGEIAIWHMDGTAVIGGGSISATVGPEWVVQGFGDFNNDGFEDLLFRNENGEPAIMLMNGTTVVGGSGFGILPADWTIQGIGDLNGDGKDDIIWRNENGEPAVWLMDGVTVIGGTGFGAVSNDWQIDNIGDFNNDGRDDFLWRHSDGTLVVWFMDGVSVIGSGEIGADISTDWIVV